MAKNGRNMYNQNRQIICKPSPFQGPPKFPLIGIFGLKTDHLGTLNRIHISFKTGFQENMTQELGIELTQAFDGECKHS
jgi:hypothetical protein